MFRVIVQNCLADRMYSDVPRVSHTSTSTRCPTPEYQSNNPTSIWGRPRGMNFGSLKPEMKLMPGVHTQNNSFHKEKKKTLDFPSNSSHFRSISRKCMLAWPQTPPTGAVPIQLFPTLARLYDPRQQHMTKYLMETKAWGCESSYWSSNTREP